MIIFLAENDESLDTNEAIKAKIGDIYPAEYKIIYNDSINCIGNEPKKPESSYGTGDVKLDKIRHFRAKTQNGYEAKSPSPGSRHGPGNERELPRVNDIYNYKYYKIKDSDDIIYVFPSIAELVHYYKYHGSGNFDSISSQQDLALIILGNSDLNRLLIQKGGKNNMPFSSKKSQIKKIFMDNNRHEIYTVILYKTDISQAWNHYKLFCRGLNSRAIGETSSGHWRDFAQELFSENIYKLMYDHDKLFVAPVPEAKSLISPAIHGFIESCQNGFSRQEANSYILAEKTYISNEDLFLELFLADFREYKGLKKCVDRMFRLIHGADMSTLGALLDKYGRFCLDIGGKVPKLHRSLFSAVIISHIHSQFAQKSVQSIFSLFAEKAYIGQHDPQYMRYLQYLYIAEYPGSYSIDCDIPISCDTELILIYDDDNAEELIGTYFLANDYIYVPR